jgi:hypothetical protein
LEYHLAVELVVISSILKLTPGQVPEVYFGKRPDRRKGGIRRGRFGIENLKSGDKVILYEVSPFGCIFMMRPPGAPRRTRIFF